MFTRKNNDLKAAHTLAKFCTFIVPLVFAVGSIGTATASTVIKTNAAKVPVADQSAQSRRTALRQAMEQVLVKMSGTDAVLAHPAIQTALQSPARYLSAYQFDYEDGRQYYAGEFSRKVLVDLLRDASLPVWGQRRPDTLIWLANQEDRDKWILREGQPGELTAVIRTASERYGVPVTLPLMDLTDNSAISVYDVWGQFGSVLNQASERYRPEFIIGARLHRRPEEATPEFLSTEEKLEQALSDSNLAFAYSAEENTTQEEENTSRFSSSSTLPVQDATPGNRLIEDSKTAGGELAQQEITADNGVEDADPAVDTAGEPTMPARAGSGEYALEWTLLEGADTQFGVVRASTAEGALSEFMHVYSQYLGQRFAVSVDADANTTGEIVSISVANLDGLEKYVHAQRFLNDMSIVKQAMLSQQNGSVATFEVKLVGTVSDFVNALSLDSQLQPVRDTFGRPLEGHNFYWNE
ncbi:DUF2066 domain-containing protein [Salinimonas sp. HHU 13199]|uniref:DUF2066 domain-containing protein n=1 Tax=Salinimonas profundi TaxID=2729140 RepID=A0ABR8LHD5_9ALTE|nr:DUF2066 domain-containing protein [Salinimonas profundi]MBD3584381.1 DUF2066 domain-containing protein [Salinimonas profundi]